MADAIDIDAVRLELSIARLRVRGVSAEAVRRCSQLPMSWSPRPRAAWSAATTYVRSTKLATTIATTLRNRAGDTTSAVLTLVPWASTEFQAEWRWSETFRLGGERSARNTSIASTVVALSVPSAESECRGA